MILAIDPGNTQSGFCLMNEVNCYPVNIGKKPNAEVRDYLKYLFHTLKIDAMAIEMVESFGMPVGMEVFDTCVAIGRFVQMAEEYGWHVQYIYRKDEKMNLCQSMKANDTTIKRALVDRFAAGEPNYGKGTKSDPGWFYGFARDMWSAYAVGVTYVDMYCQRKHV